MSNALERILSRLEQNDEAVSTKTAAAASPELSSEEKMLSTVRSLTAATTKTASASAPVASLEKLASDAHAAESQILSQKAASLGSALADGFMSRFAQYDTALGDVAVKTASTPDMAGLTKQAYAAARADLEKQASDDYNQGYTDQLEAVQKLAAHCHISGQQSARNVLIALSED